MTLKLAVSRSRPPVLYWANFFGICFSLLRQEIGWEERLWNDLFWSGWM